MRSQRITASAVACLLVAVSGCATSQPKNQAALGRRLHRQGDIVYFMIDLGLAEEQRGERPLGRAKTWRQHWESSISLWRRSNHSEYEHYFMRRRKQIGLKDLATYEGKDDLTSRGSELRKLSGS